MSRETWKPELVDLRAVTRDADRFLTEVRVVIPESRNEHVWIKAGLGDLINEGNNQGIRIRLKAGVTDGEHDSAIAVSIPLIGLEFEFVSNGVLYAKAWIATNPGNPFRVSPPGYNPAGAEGVHICSGDSGCSTPHPMVDYLPPETPELWSRMRGWKVKIMMSPHVEKTKPNAWRELAEELAEITGRSRVFEKLPNVETKTEVSTLWERMRLLVDEEAK